MGVQHFECSVCKKSINEQDDLDLCIENDKSFERVKTFCYLKDLLNFEGGCERDVLPIVNKAWNKLSELKSSLSFRIISRNVKGKFIKHM